MNAVIFDIALVASIFIAIPVLIGKNSYDRMIAAKASQNKEKSGKKIRDKGKNFELFLFFMEIVLVFLMVKNVDDTLIATLMFAATIMFTLIFSTILSEFLLKGENIKERMKKDALSVIPDDLIESGLTVLLLFYSAIYAFLIYVIATYIF